MKREISDVVEIKDVTTAKDDPYDDWSITPMEKFIDELFKEGYIYEDIYRIDLDKEEGILIEYDLLPREILKWDDEEKLMKLKMKYTPLLKYRKALDDLGIIYDREYWK